MFFLPINAKTACHGFIWTGVYVRTPERPSPYSSPNMPTYQEEGGLKAPFHSHLPVGGDQSRWGRQELASNTRIHDTRCCYASEWTCSILSISKMAQQQKHTRPCSFGPWLGRGTRKVALLCHPSYSICEHGQMTLALEGGRVATIRRKPPDRDPGLQ